MAITRSYQPSAQTLGKAAYSAGAGITALEDRRIAEQRAYQDQQRQQQQEFQIAQYNRQLEAQKDAEQRRLQAQMAMDNLNTRNNIIQMQAQNELRGQFAQDQMAMEVQAEQQRYDLMTQRQKDAYQGKLNQYQDTLEKAKDMGLKGDAYFDYAESLARQFGVPTDPIALKEQSEQGAYRTVIDVNGEQVKIPREGTPEYTVFMMQREAKAEKDRNDALVAAAKQNRVLKEAELANKESIADIQVKGKLKETEMQAVIERRRKALEWKKDRQDQWDEYRKDYMDTHRDALKLASPEQRREIMQQAEEDANRRIESSSYFKQNPYETPENSTSGAPRQGEGRSALAILSRGQVEQAEAHAAQLVAEFNAPMDPQEMRNFYAKIDALKQSAENGDLAAQAILEAYMRDTSPSE